MKYRPEIDGLRAVAVTAVILFHSGFNVFKGGFVGVDIFFVISGFLITSIIFDDIQNQSFSFVNFYARRIGRILPPLFFVMLVSIPFAWLLLLPAHLKEFSKSFEWIPIFLSNVFFMHQSGYFDTAIEIKPFIHTWSLAVEEQYYLFFPPLLVIIYKFKRNWIVPTFLTLGLFSFLITQSNLISENANFYLLPTRAWELLIGVCLAIYLPSHAETHLNNGKLIISLGTLGLLMIIGSIFLISQDERYPGTFTLIPAIGTALVILSSSHKNIINRILGSGFLVQIGLMSYSAYLWHQPIFAFVRYSNFSEPSHFTFVWLIFITFLMAYLTWKYIENPFRKLARTNPKRIFTLYTAFAIFFISLGVLGEKKSGFPQRFNQSGELTSKLAHKEIECTDSRDGFCSIGQTKPEFAVFGDSHAWALGPMFNIIQSAHKFPYVFNQAGRCPPLIGVHVLSNTDKPDDDYCYKLNQKRFDYVSSKPSIKKVFLVARWSVYTDGGYEGRNIGYLALGVSDERNKDVSRGVFSSQLKATVEAYQKLGVRVYIVLQAPQQKVNVSQLFYYIDAKKLNANETLSVIHSKSISIERHDQLHAFYRNEISKIKTQLGAEVVNLDPEFCDDKICYAGAPNDPYYVDTDHLSTAGALKTSRLFIDAILEK